MTTERARHDLTAASNAYETATGKQGFLYANRPATRWLRDNTPEGSA